MIKIIGVVEFLTSESSDSYILDLSNIRLQPIEVKSRVTSSGNRRFKIACKFEIFLNEDPLCKYLNDYVGKINPFLNSFLPSAFILNTQHYDISQVDGSIKHITEFF